MKYGLWEEGKRIEWILPDTAQLIMKGKYDYSNGFKKQESINSVD
jgi:hypothetical protein